MNDLEPKLGPEYIQSTIYYDKLITDTNVCQYILDALKAYDPIPESDKAPDIQDNIIEAYFE